MILFDPRGLLDNFEVDPFIFSPFTLVVGNPDSTYFTGVFDMCAPICLEVKVDDLYNPDLVDLGWEKVDLGAYEIRYLERFFSWDYPASNRMRFFDL